MFFNQFRYQRLECVPPKFSIFLAHEFFDALPIHKFEKVNNDWREVLVNLDCNKNFVLSTAAKETAHSKLYKARTGFSEKRSHVEYSFETEILISQIADRLECYGGFGLIMDYGHFGEKCDTFRAFKNHKIHDPMCEPGSADLTADVDFKAIKHIAEKDKKLITVGPVDQGDFLHRLGGEFRLNVLLENATDEQAKQLQSGYKSLTEPDKMGKRFKMFALYPRVLEQILKQSPSFGFEDNEVF